MRGLFFCTTFAAKFQANTATGSHCKTRSRNSRAQNTTTMATTFNHDAIQMIASGVMNAKQLSLLLEADLLNAETNIDELQCTRVCTILHDAQEQLVKGDKGKSVGLAEMSLALAATLYPEEYEHGGEFVHKGCAYQVELRRKPILTDDDDEPLRGKEFEKIYRIDAQKAALAEKQSSLTRKRADAIKDVIALHPYLRFEETRTLKVMRK